MLPPKPINGHIIPGFVPWRHLRRAVYPPSLYERLKALPGFDPRKLTFDLDEERRAVQVLSREESEAWIRFHIEREGQWFNILSELISTEDWNLAGWVADGFDKLGHGCWQFMDPALFGSSQTPSERRLCDLCLEYFSTLDNFLGELFAKAGDDTVVFIVSDHGFCGSDEIFYVNTWLEQHGYLKWLKEVPNAKEGMLNTEGSKTVTYLFDWSHTNAFSMTAGSNGIYIRVAEKPGQYGIPPESYCLFRNKLAEALRSVTNPSTGRRVIQEVLTRDQAFAGNCGSMAPDLTLILRDHGFVSVLKSDTVVKQRSQIVGTHHPEGVFMAAGPGIKRGIQIAALSILDVAPAVLYSLGLPTPVDLEGHFPSVMFEAATLSAVPFRREGTTVPSAVEQGAIDTEAAAIILDRLRDLGYMS